MINQRHCPFCRRPAIDNCNHLAVAVEGRDFVSRCIELCQAQALWRSLCQQRKEGQLSDDFTWLETAFCDQFLKHLRWFGGMDYEWRTGPQLHKGGFWVLVWSKEPRRLWWELRDELEQRITLPVIPLKEASPWLIWMTPR